jgi:hypothetical protein
MALALWLVYDGFFFYTCSRGGLYVGWLYVQLDWLYCCALQLALAVGLHGLLRG